MFGRYPVRTGISAHETTEMEVFNSEVAWNGSISGGVTDVNDAVTSYVTALSATMQEPIFLHRQSYPSTLLDLQSETAFHITRKLILKKSETKLNNDEIGIMALHFSFLGVALLTGAVNERRLSHWAGNLARMRGLNEA